MDERIANHAISDAFRTLSDFSLAKQGKPGTITTISNCQDLHFAAMFFRLVIIDICHRDNNTNVSLQIRPFFETVTAIHRGSIILL